MSFAPSSRSRATRTRGTRTVYGTLQPGEALPPVHEDKRAKLWKAAQRQRGKIEKQRSKNADADAEHQPSKKLKVHGQTHTRAER